MATHLHTTTAFKIPHSAPTAAFLGVFLLAHPDAELLRHCSTAIRAWKESEAILDGVAGLPAHDPQAVATFEEADRVGAVYGPAIAAALSLPSRTPEGLRAKAELVLLQLQGFAPDYEIALSLARDVLSVAA